MILDVKLIKNTSVFCEESAAATAAASLGHNYEMMFIDMVNFNFSEKSSKDIIGSRLSCGYDDYDFYKNLQEYHGISSHKKIIVDNIEEVVKKEIDNKIPLLVFPLQRYCDWIDLDGDEPLYFFAIGYSKTYVYGYDIHSNSSQIMKISWNSMRLSYTKKYNNSVRVYREVAEEKKDIDLFTKIKEIYQQKYWNKDVFQQILEFASEVKKGIDFKNEQGEICYIDEIPLLFEVMQILRARKLLAQTCFWFDRMKSDIRLREIGTFLMELGGQWNVVWNLMLKLYYFDSEMVNYEEKIAERITRIAYMEKELMQNILENKKINGNIVTVSNSIEEDKKYAVKDIDITSLLNNKGFQFDNEDVFKADLTGHEEHFIGNSSLSTSGIKIGNTVFKIQNNNYDNFVCKGQVINIEPSAYKKIYILACAEWGNSIGKIIVGYEHEQKILLCDFIDWFYSETGSSYVAWKGKAVDSTGEVVNRALFCLDFDLVQNDKIYWLKFEECENVHIFGIKMLY